MPTIKTHSLRSTVSMTYRYAIGTHNGTTQHTQRQNHTVIYQQIHTTQSSDNYVQLLHYVIRLPSSGQSRIQEAAELYSHVTMYNIHA